MRYVITTPEPRWTGVVAGVAFAHGEGITAEDPPVRVLNYFRRRGYGVTAVQAAPEPASEPAPGGQDETSEAPPKPAANASKADLVAYTVAVLGLSEDEATAKTRVDLLGLIDQHEKETAQ